MLILKKIVVDCERNDPVDIRIGGPQYLGFDFFVKDEDVDTLREVILAELHKNKIPCISISIEEETRSNAKIWDKEKIIECIKEGY